MTDFLTLSDEIIGAVGQYTRQDSNMPVPSFYPHWENFKSEIDEKNIHDFANFRLVSKKFSQACPLQGVNKNLDSWRRVRLLHMDRGGQRKGAIRRIRLDVNKLPDVISTFSTLIIVLSYCTTLEELIIDNVPFCEHDQGEKFATHHISFPKDSQLSNLKSLSMNLDCSKCSDYLLKLFAAVSPKLEHLKMRLIGPRRDNVNTTTPTFRPVSQLQWLSSRWCSYNKQDCMPLKTLFIRITDHQGLDKYREGMVDVIYYIGKLWPTLQDLQVGRYEDKTGNMIEGFPIQGRKIEDNGEWHFTLTETREDASEGDPDDTWYLSDGLSYMNLPRSLRIFDPCIVLALDMSRSSTVTPKKDELKAEFLQRLNDPNNPEKTGENLVKYENRFKEAIKLVAETMIEYLPNLQEGYIWERDSSIGNVSDTPDLWYRWSWKKLSDHKEENIRIVVEDSPMVLTSNFVRNWRPRGRSARIFDDDDSD